MCEPGTPPDCSDNIGCTDDSCNETTDSCDNVDNCSDDNLFCNGTEFCNGLAGCTSTGDPCPVGTVCNEATDLCDDVCDNCDDGLHCNGLEVCVDFVCEPGTPPDCNDNVGCTDDSCNEVTDSCDNITNNSNCDNNQHCDGAETCHQTQDCQNGVAPNCDDSVGCTDDSCNEVTDSCDNITNNSNCDNNQYCDGAETCHQTQDCQNGVVPNCDDSVGCTDDSCNEVTDSCDNIANDGNCPDDGLFCNGNEFCGVPDDCSSTGDPCLVGTTCNEATDTCPEDCTTGCGEGCCNNGLCEQDVTSQDCIEGGGTPVSVCLGDSDEDGNNDACVCPSRPTAPQLPIFVDGYAPKNRYISFVPGNAARTTAIRVKLVSLDGFPSFNDEVRWVGPPTQYQEGTAPDPKFWASQLQCTPHYLDWGLINELHVFGAEILPSSFYYVQMIDEHCLLEDGSNFSVILSLTTSLWGDVTSFWNGSDWPVPNGQVTFDDVTAVMDKFKEDSNAMLKVRAQLQSNVVNPSDLVDIADVELCIDAFLGEAYPYPGPQSCP